MVADRHRVLNRRQTADTVAAMPKLKHRKLRKEIIAACRAMNDLGINQGTSGNISARIDGGFLITPSGIPYDLMEPEQIVEMDLSGGYYGLMDIGSPHPFSAESGKNCRMDINDLPCPSLSKFSRKNGEESGQHNQVDIPGSV